MPIKLTDRAHGNDISKYDLVYDPTKATHQQDFVVQRLSYGLREDELRTVLKPGVVQKERRGAYHYYSTAVGWKDQCDFFLELAGNDYKFLWWDYERYYNNLNGTTADHSRRAIEYLKASFPGKVCLYTNPDIYKKYLNPYGVWQHQEELALAQYWYFPSPDKNPGMSGMGRTAWTFWQYRSNGNGTWFGLGRSWAADCDVFNGSVDELDNWIGVPPPPPPTPLTLEERVEKLELAVFG